MPDPTAVELGIKISLLVVDNALPYRAVIALVLVTEMLLPAPAVLVELPLLPMTILAYAVPEMVQ